MWSYQSREKQKELQRCSQWMVVLQVQNLYFVQTVGFMYSVYYEFRIINTFHVFIYWWRDMIKFCIFTVPIHFATFAQVLFEIEIESSKFPTQRVWKTLCSIPIEVSGWLGFTTCISFPPREMCSFERRRTQAQRRRPEVHGRPTLHVLCARRRRQHGDRGRQSDQPHADSAAIPGSPLRGGRREWGRGRGVRRGWWENYAKQRHAKHFHAKMW